MADYTVSTNARREIAITRTAQSEGATNTQVAQFLLNRALDQIIATHDKIDADDIWELARTATGAARQQALNTLAASVAPPTVSPVSNQSHPVNIPVQIQIVASDPSDNMQLSYKATNLPPGITMNAQGGGFIAGIPTTPGVYSVTIRVVKLFMVFTDISFTWTITP